ncbi:hypothetical protein HN789_03305 [archaeon]|jgi:hypothetical protein|nr:hypothetical protein [Candidatus Woesearchaeota archaeon]MBT3720201.1 hypothetical protein [archaeon]MBT4022628.1 hypothetical protein [archaeon]MBT4272068.1 hypothetical protein [archaeon]MBT4461165.1 hypothetical protein [archaeon]
MGCCNIKDKKKRDSKFVVLLKLFFILAMQLMFKIFIIFASLFNKKYKRISKTFTIYCNDLINDLKKKQLKTS